MGSRLNRRKYCESKRARWNLCGGQNEIAERWNKKKSHLLCGNGYFDFPVSNRALNGFLFNFFYSFFLDYFCFLFGYFGRSIAREYFELEKQQLHNADSVDDGFGIGLWFFRSARPSLRPRPHIHRKVNALQSHASFGTGTFSYCCCLVRCGLAVRFCVLYKVDCFRSNDRPINAQREQKSWSDFSQEANNVHGMDMVRVDPRSPFSGAKNGSNRRQTTKTS